MLKEGLDKYYFYVTNHPDVKVLCKQSCKVSEVMAATVLLMCLTHLVWLLYKYQSQMPYQLRLYSILDVLSMLVILFMASLQVGPKVLPTCPIIFCGLLSI